ncbi:hypothetical protein STEG23_022443, partial [Scotinomys teguina]
TGKHSFNKELIHRGRPEKLERKGRLVHSGHVIGFSFAFNSSKVLKKLIHCSNRGPSNAVSSWGPSKAIPPTPWVARPRFIKLFRPTS